ncbi:MAG: DUF881 domain-containing protein [Fimbriimonadaceae bacterium]
MSRLAVKPLINRSSEDRWVWPVSAMCVLLGFMLTRAWVTDQSRTSRFKLLAPQIQARVGSGSLDLQEEAKKMETEVQHLQDENTKMEVSLSTQTGSTKVLNEQLQEAKVFAGLTEVEGPGLVVTLRDSTKPPQSFVQEQIIHDGDVLRVVNELWNAGAEAIAVNGHRVVTTTSIRCVGSTILVNNTPIASPVAIRALGDPATLEGALNLPAGVLSEIRSIDPAMVQLTPVKAMRLAAFSGSTEHRLLKVPAPTK